MLDERGRVRRVVGEDAHAERRRDAPLRFADTGVGLAQRVDDLHHHALDADHVLHALEHDEEFVAAEARHEVARPHVAAQALCDLHQERIARGMAVPVVDLLEAVEIHEHAGDLVALAPRALDRLLERRRKAHAVGEPGQRIAVGERGDALARERDLGDVAPDAAIAEEQALRVVARLAAHREVARGSVRQPARDLEVAERQPALKRCPVRLPAGLVGAHRSELPRRLAKLSIADRRGVARAVHHAREPVLGVAFPEKVARELREAAKARLALAQRFLGVLPLQELAEQAADGAGRVDEAAVGLVRRVRREGQQRDGAPLQHDGQREGAVAAALAGASQRRRAAARQVRRPYGLAGFPVHARAAQELLDLPLAREPAIGVAHFAARLVDAEAAPRVPAFALADDA